MVDRSAKSIDSASPGESTLAAPFWKGISSYLQRFRQTRNSPHSSRAPRCAGCPFRSEWMVDQNNAQADHVVPNISAVQRRRSGEFHTRSGQRLFVEI